MKLSKEFVVHNIIDESILLPTGKAAFSGVVRGNKTLGTVLELLKDDTTEEELIIALKKRYEAPDGAIEKDIKKVLDELRKIKALDE